MSGRYIRDRTALDMKVYEAAWLAGFVDGEGCISSFMARGKYKNWFLQIGNTNLSALEYCQRITGCGRIIKKKEAHGNYKTQWQWRVSAQRDLVAVLEQITPYLIIKSEAAHSFLDEWVAPEIQRVAQPG